MNNGKPTLRDENGIRTQMVTAKRIENLVKFAEREAEAMTQLSLKKIAVASEFLDQCQEEGLGKNDFIQLMKESIDLCKEKKDTRTLMRLITTWREIMLSPSFEMGLLLNQAALISNQTNQQNNFYGNEGPDEKELEEIDAEIKRREGGDQ